jgi:hypothetical protein
MCVAQLRHQNAFEKIEKKYLSDLQVMPRGEDVAVAFFVQDQFGNALGARRPSE